MSGGGAKNPSTRLLPPIKNPLFNPNEDQEEVRVTSVVSFFLCHFLNFISFFRVVMINYVCCYRTVIQNGPVLGED